MDSDPLTLDAANLDLNLVGTSSTCKYAIRLLTSKFEMKLLGRTAFFLGVQIEHSSNGSIFLYQKNHSQKLLKSFNMDQAHPLSTPIMGQSKTLDDPYQPCEEEKEQYDNKHQYLAAIGALIYLAMFTRLDISFATSVLARHS